MITFIDIEYDENNKKIYDFGAVKEDNKTFHGSSFKGFLKFIKGSDFYCGHKIVDHDAKQINAAIGKTIIRENERIDTLLLSVLLLPLLQSSQYRRQ